MDKAEGVKVSEIVKFEHKIRAHYHPTLICEPLSLQLEQIQSAVRQAKVQLHSDDWVHSHVAGSCAIILCGGLN